MPRIATQRIYDDGQEWNRTAWDNWCEAVKGDAMSIRCAVALFRVCGLLCCMGLSTSPGLAQSPAQFAGAKEIRSRDGQFGFDAWRFQDWFPNNRILAWRKQPEPDGTYLEI